MSKKDHPFTSNSNGAQNLWTLAEENNGAILISAHLGNWEIAGHFLNRFKTPINIVLYDGEHQRIKAMLDSVMIKKRFNIIAVKEDFSHLIAINLALKNKEFVCIHADRFPDPKRSKKMSFEFLGKEAFFPVGPFSLATKLKVPYCFVYAVKTGRYHYEFYAFDSKTESNDERDIMKAFVRQLEFMALKYPTQWFNFFPFWQEEQNKLN